MGKNFFYCSVCKDYKWHTYDSNTTATLIVFKCKGCNLISVTDLLEKK